MKDLIATIVMLPLAAGLIYCGLIGDAQLFYLNGAAAFVGWVCLECWPD